MAKSIRASSEELKAFFRACEKNGIEISSKPKKVDESTPIIVNKNGHRFTVSDAVAENPTLRVKNTSAQRVKSVETSDLNVQINRAIEEMAGIAKRGACRRKADAHYQRDLIPYNKRKGTI